MRLPALCSRRLLMMSVAAASDSSCLLSAAGTEPKRRRGSVRPTIGTHDGTFHCDEALACFLLRQLPEYQDAEVVRSRDPQVLKDCDVVVDVGGVYDPTLHRYDHHQRSFTETMSSLRPGSGRCTKLSSAGLVYLHFGPRILSQCLGLQPSDPALPTLMDKVYENFVEEIDAVDNGIAQYEGEPRYTITTNLSCRVSHLNPPWNAENQDTQAAFVQAMQLVGSEFLDRLTYYHRSWLPARELVEEAIRGLCEADASGEIMILKQGGCPWKEHLFELEKELSLSTPIKFILYTDQRGQWRVQCVPETPTSFRSRLPLPEAWRGLRDEDLTMRSGIPGCVFVHANGFIGGNTTQEGALHMAQETLRQAARGEEA
ncbi:MYG1 exonuclease isoform X1 [Mobula birostris]|uniref:MYG1 exonuclease isoform X1 n=2 Tax=Mobula birostris TaxID=1983395 RepID=UPI003B27BF96